MEEYNEIIRKGIVYVSDMSKKIFLDICYINGLNVSAGEIFRHGQYYFINN